MLITNDFVFVHVPKTGGTFIQRVIRDHLPVIEARGVLNDSKAWTHESWSSLPTPWRDLPAFCFVRNPWDWYVSWYHDSTSRRSRRVGGEDRYGKLALWEGAFQGGKADFKEAVTRACVGGFDHPLATLMREEGLDLYSARVQDIAGAALERPNFTVLRLEDGLRKQLVRYLRAHSKVPRSLVAAIRESPPIRVSDHRRYPAYYDDELRDLVGEKARWLCDRFEYQFSYVPDL